MLGFDPAQQVLVGSNSFRRATDVLRLCSKICPGEARSPKPCLDLLSQARQHWLEEDCHPIECGNAVAADLVQLRVFSWVLGELPWLLGIEILVYFVGVAHHQSQRPAKLTLLVCLRDVVLDFGGPYDRKACVVNRCSRR